MRKCNISLFTWSLLTNTCSHHKGVMPVSGFIPLNMMQFIYPYLTFHWISDSGNLGTEDHSFGPQPTSRHCRQVIAYKLSWSAWAIMPSSFRMLLKGRSGGAPGARLAVQAAGKQWTHMETLHRSFGFPDFLSINNDNRTWPSEFTLSLKAKFLIFNCDLF